MSAKIPILLYHRIGERDGTYMDKYTVSPKTFKLQMEWIRKHNWKPIALEELMTQLKHASVEPSLVITFDDGFLSNRVHAWPILEDCGFPATTFIVDGMLGSFNHWDGPGKDEYPLLSVEDLGARASQLMTFHSHSATHPKLTLLSQTDLRTEIGKSRQSAVIRHAPETFFAYPFGALNREVIDEVRKAGFVGGCTCFGGLNSERTDPFLLRRVEIQEIDLGWRLWLKVNTGRDIFAKPLWFSELRVRVHDARLRSGKLPL